MSGYVSFVLRVRGLFGKRRNSAVIKRLPSQNYLLECVHYEERTGLLLWKHRPLWHFRDARQYRSWNKRFEGKRAFATPTGTRDYLCGKLDSRTLLAHRVIWKIVTGKEPPFLIDHEDTDGFNNRWKNLRDANLSQNRINSEAAEGVHRLKNGGGWQAYVGVSRKLICLGTFRTRREAKAARAAGLKKYYGEFARCA
jgi:HNH endonuclease